MIKNSCFGSSNILIKTTSAATTAPSHGHPQPLAWSLSLRRTANTASHVAPRVAPTSLSRVPVCHVGVQLRHWPTCIAYVIIFFIFFKFVTKICWQILTADQCPHFWWWFKIVLSPKFGDIKVINYHWTIARFSHLSPKILVANILLISNLGFLSPKILVIKEWFSTGECVCL